MMKADLIKLPKRGCEWLLGLVCLLCFVCASEGALAQTSSRAFQVQQFRPWGDPQGLFQTQSGTTLGQWNYYAGLIVNYAHNPLIANTGNGRSQSLISDHWAADFVASLGVFDLLDVSLSLPMTLYQVGFLPNHPAFPEQDRNQDISGFALSDMRLGAKVRILREDRNYLSLAMLVYIGLPSGRSDLFNGEGSVKAGVGFFLSRRIGIAQLALNVGYRYLPATAFVDLRIEHEFVYSLGASFQVGRVDLILDASGAAELSGELSWITVPIDLYAGLRIFLDNERRLALQAGVAFGLNAGYGVPVIRALLGLTWGTRDKDEDGDTVVDRNDECPKEAGPIENKGCPWRDYDNDGINDKLDKCIYIPGPIENKGCPWPDTDLDGVTDNIDACPKQKGPGLNRGCPWPDTDKDGLTDNIDACPKLKGPKANKGCPYGDTDKDGLDDNVDRCPKEKGPKENKGCPDKDIDGDSVIDRLDKCPNVPGVKVATKGVKLGCPKQMLVQLTRKEIKILQKIQFRTGSATIRKASFALLTQVISVLKSRPDIDLEIEGHTDDVGNKEYNLKLSMRRARSVYDFLVKKGNIPKKRLNYKGFGMSKPLVPNTSAANRAKNRRVVFSVIQRHAPLPPNNK